MRRPGLLLTLCLAVTCAAQQDQPPKPQVQKVTPVHKPNEAPEPGVETPAEQPARAPRVTAAGEERREPQKEQHFDLRETAPVVTRHQIVAHGRTLRYTASVGKLPIKDAMGNAEALMFYVAYTLDGANPAERPLTFAFNGGPGSSSIWLHMGALGPRRVVLQSNGFMPAAPYRLTNNQDTLLDKSDLVLVDAIGTGFSRPADAAAGKKFWSVNGDIESFSEFIRLYISRNERWASPLFLFGESYGTTRAAGVAGYLAAKGISFNGITLLSSVLSFQTLEFNKTNDLPYPLLLPSFAMIAAYHHRLPPELSGNLDAMRKEVEQWASTDYTQVLAKGDALTGQERQAAIDKLARYTGLAKDIIDQANLRIDVALFTHYLLAGDKLRVGRLDGRYSGPDPEGFTETRFYDPTSAATEPPFNSVFNDYVRRELNYKTDMPYYVMAREAWGGAFDWNWGSAIQGFPDTASALRQAIVRNPYLKIFVLEGYYDLATPYYAANYTMDHLNISERYRKNISYATYLSGHMIYLDEPSLERMNADVAQFMRSAQPHETTSIQPDSGRSVAVSGSK